MRNGEACAPDEGSTKAFEVVSESDKLFLKLSDSAENAA